MTSEKKLFAEVHVTNDIEPGPYEPDIDSLIEDIVKISIPDVPRIRKIPDGTPSEFNNAYLDMFNRQYIERNKLRKQYITELSQLIKKMELDVVTQESDQESEMVALNMQMEYNKQFLL